jgi:hypothetical protein
MGLRIINSYVPRWGMNKSVVMSRYTFLLDIAKASLESEEILGYTADEHTVNM